MAEVKFKKTTSENLDSVPVSDGQIVAVTDTGELHIDFDGARTKYGGGSEVDLSENSVRIGEETSSSTDSVVVGYGAATAYLGGVAVGKEAAVMSQYGLALGNQAKVDTNADFAISIGDKAKATHEGAIQLGFGTSKEDYSLSVGLGLTNDENYILLTSDGKIPDVRLSSNVVQLDADGKIPDDRLSANIARTENVVGKTEAQESYAPLIHSHSGYATVGSLTAVGETASEAKENADSALAQIENLDIPDTSTLVKYMDIRDDTVDSIVIGTTTNAATATSTGCVIIGQGATTNKSSTAIKSTAIGNAAKAYGLESTALGYSSNATSSYSVCVGDGEAGASYAISIGKGANAGGGYGVSVGASSKASSSYALGVGYNAKATGSYAIQLGYGTNSTANTFSVGLSNSTNYTLLNADGKIPIERIPDGVSGSSWDWEELEDTALESLVLDNIVTVFTNDLVTADFTNISVSGDDLYSSQSIVRFHSGATPTVVTCGNVKFIGLHCYAGVFTPQKNTYYTITVQYLYPHYVASVGGYAG